MNEQNLQTTITSYGLRRETDVPATRELQIMTLRNRFGLPRHRAVWLAEIYFGEVPL